MLTNPTASILHLSDLHFGSDFYDIGNKNRSDGMNLQSGLAAIKNRGRLVMQSHDDYILTSLPTDIQKAAGFIGAHERKFDFHIVTGDISTTATSAERFSFAREFLVQRVSVKDQNSGQSFDVGLNLGRDTVFCIPGNHDKLGQVDLRDYLSAFADLPQKPPYVIEKVSRAKQLFIFFAIDSNDYSEDNTAVGKISAVTLGWLKEQFQKYESLNVTESQAVRVLLLHHHPADLNLFRGRSVWQYLRIVNDNPFTRLEEGDRLLEACRGNVDIIMHGHEHFPIAFFNRESNCLIVSAGTTSKLQLGSHNKNSFHVLAFSGRKFHIVQYDWFRGRFATAYEWTGDLDQAGCNLVGSRLDRR
jgi:3',5'-cyclic AMP phosphodiesterase CpdA